MKDKYKAGINLGGWLSQYKEFDHEHFKTFISKQDIEQIASWGADHVRLPIDYPVLLEEDLKTFSEQGLSYVDNCLEWCQAAGLNLILDLHKAPGYSFTNTLVNSDGTTNSLFDDPQMQGIFISFWESLTRRYSGVGNSLVFELLNEIVLPDSAPWNALTAKTISAIHALDPQRPILIGGNFYNDASQLPFLTLYDDPLVFYTFHYYNPMLFTHQHAYWVPFVGKYNETLDYPGPIPGVDELLDKNPQFEDFLGNLRGRTMDRQLLKDLMAPALDWMKETGRWLYCGEFGVIELAPKPSNCNWHRDMLSIMEEAGIGWGVWSYKQLDFGLVDGEGKVVDPELIKVLFGK